jgi:hypothetical protein
VVTDGFGLVGPLADRLHAALFCHINIREE